MLFSKFQSHRGNRKLCSLVGEVESPKSVGMSLKEVSVGKSLKGSLCTCRKVAMK